jgi:hypothetical protein
MHTDIGIPPSVSSLAANIQGWVSPLATKMQRWMASSIKKVKKGITANLYANRVRNAIPPIAAVGGAVAFGFWWDSVSAGLFAFFAFSLLAGIYQALRQIVVTFRRERDRVIVANANWNASPTVDRGQPNFEVGARAIEHLRPWVEDETSLTEEKAKACCSVLLDTLAALHPKFAQPSLGD